MTKNFNKTLLAAALIAAAGSATAANLAAPTVVGLSKQASTSALTINGPDLTLTTGIPYGVNFEIVLSFSGGEMTVAPAAPAGFVRTTQTATTATYRANTTIASGTALTFSGYQFTSASALAAGSIIVSALTKADTGVLVDPAGSGDKLSQYVLRTGDQFAAEEVEAAKVIDLGAVRKAFTGSTAAAKYTYSVGATSQNLTGLPASGSIPAATFTTLATAGAVKHTVKGDFSWIQDTNATTADIQPATGTVSATTGCTINSVKAMEIVYTCTAPGTNSLTFDVRQGGTASPVSLNDGTYTVTVEHAYGSAGQTFMSLNEVAATKFTNNGTDHDVYYMPYGSGISQIIYVTNTTNQVGAVRVTAWDENGNKALDGVKVADTVASGITQLSQPIREALAEQGVTSGKVRLKIDVETSGSQVFAAYNARGDRLATK